MELVITPRTISSDNPSSVQWSFLHGLLYPTPSLAQIGLFALTDTWNLNKKDKVNLTADLTS